MGIKQEGLAYLLGGDWSQKRVSLLEGKEEVDDAILEEVARVLKIPADAIRNFDENAAVNIIQNTITNNDNSSVYGSYHFNPLEKLFEVIEKNEQLYERLLQAEQARTEALERLLKEK